jgi:hypothetical protein
MIAERVAFTLAAPYATQQQQLRAYRAFYNTARRLI